MFFSFRLRTDQPVEGIPWPASLGNSLDSEPAVDPYAVNTPRGDPVKGIITKCMHAKLSSPILATWRYANSHNLVWFAIFTAPLPPSLTPIGSADIPRAGDIWICTRLGEEEVYWKDYNGIWQLWDDVYPFTHHPFIQQAILLAGSGNNLAAPRWMDARGNSSNGKSTLSRNGARKGHDVARHISLNLLRTSTEISLTQRRGARTGAHISRRGVKRGLSDVNGVEREVGMSQSGFTDFTYGAGLDSPSPRRPSDKPLALLDELPLPPFGEATDAATGTDDTNPIAVLYDYRATCHSNHIGRLNIVSDTRQNPLNDSIASGKGQLAWERAECIKAELMEQGPAAYSSSAWIISAAYEEFSNGVKTMKALKKVQTPTECAYVGVTDGITSLTNGILRDERAFAIDDPNWLKYFNDLITHLNPIKKEHMPFFTKAWMTGGPRAVKESALSRLHRMGWEDVRPALSTTIRGWIMRGFVESCVRGNHALGLEFLGCALEVLEWGRTEWAGVPDDKRGAIFHNAFIRGVRCMRLKVLGVDYRAGLSDRSRDDSLGKLREILAESDAILDDGEVQSLQANVVYEPGSILSFIIYPRGRALAMKGFYYKQMVLSKTLRTAQEVEDHFRNAAKYYLQAAETFSEDDEQHTWYLYAALENLFKAGTPIKATLPIMKRIGLSMDKMKRIWEYSAMAMGCRDKTLERAIRMQRDVVKGMREGRYTMEDKVMPHPPWDYNIAADP